jgi:hypothetical protein
MDALRRLDGKSQSGELLLKETMGRFFAFRLSHSWDRWARCQHNDALLY